MKGSLDSPKPTGCEIVVCVHFLDSSTERFHLSVLTLGQELYNMVVEHLKLVEYDYFDLEYVNKDGYTFWLDHMKPLQKQHTVHKDYVYTFAVKFYTPHPNLLEDEFTRCLFALQIRKDLQSGRLTCSENTAALLSAFIVQSHIGDFLEDVYLNHSYLSGFQLLPTTTASFLKKVATCHRSILGQSPADADYNLLDTARKVELYGTRMHPARDSAGTKLHLSVTHSGVLVYQRQLKINTFSWARIRKLSFKRKRFILKLHSECCQTAEFVFDSRDECKSFWKQCIEHHAFFRCQAVRQPTQHRGPMLTKGSSFRYTGRTQKQLLDYVRDNYVKLPHFERSSSANRVLTTNVPGTLLPELLAAQVTSSSGAHAAAGTHSDYGPRTSYISQARPQTDPAQRTHLTDSCISSSPARSFAIAVPVVQQGPDYPPGQTLRQVRSSSVATEIALPNTLPRGSRLLSIIGGTASSGSYTMNSSASAGSPVASSSPVSSPQSGKKAVMTTAEYPAQILLTSQLGMQNLSFQPLPLVDAAAGVTPVVTSGWRASIPRTLTPSQTGVVVARFPGAAYQRPLGVAVVPAESSMHTSLLLSSQPSNSPQLGCGVPVVAFGTAASVLAPTITTTTNQATVARLPTHSGAVAGEVTAVTPQGTHFNVPPGYAVLARTSGLSGLGNQVIYIDRTTGKPLLPVIPSSGQRMLDDHTSTVTRKPNVNAVEHSHGLILTGNISTTQANLHQHHPPPTDVPATASDKAAKSSEVKLVNGVEIRRRPYGPAPPAPERRDSKLCGLTSMANEHRSVDAHQLPLKSTACDWPMNGRELTLIDSGAEDDDIGSPQSSHPLATGFITGPNGFHSVSCLSLATRSALSARNLCISAGDDSIDGSRGSTPDRNGFGTPGNCQSDTESSSRRVRRSSPISRSQEEDDEQQPSYGQCDRGRSRSASCRHSHRHHHHRSKVRHARCRSAIDPSVDLPEGDEQGIMSTERGSTGAISSSAQHQLTSSAQRMLLLPRDITFHIISDLVMTERTYGRDLSVVCVCFRQTNTWLDEEAPTSSQNRTNVRFPDNLANSLFTLLDPIYTEHQKVLACFESRLAAWNRRRDSEDAAVSHYSTEDASNFSESSPMGEHQPPVHRVGDIFLAHVSMLLHYQKFIAEVEQLILSLERTMRSDHQLEESLRRFEAQKFCYLPFYVFLLKPMHRLLQYRVVLERLMRQYDEAHIDGPDCRAFHSRLLDLIQSQWDSYRKAENTYKLLEVQRDLCGLMPFPIQSNEYDRPDNSTQRTGPLFRAGRQFIREGWLQKLTKKGYQPRIFFLFSDQLIYASRTTTAVPQFKVHGQFPLYDLMVEEAEPAHSFTVFSGNRCFLVAAPSDWQRDRWLEDISRAILAAKTRPSLKMENAAGASEAALDAKSETLRFIAPSEELTHALPRATTSAHVCWHRGYTLSMQDILRANEYETSGYLLRKFKNSNGWQRLWVVFAQNCLFFYKSYREDCPLASLPLLGYTISTPAPGDRIRRDNVIKLQFKNHVYFFRGETFHAFERWLEYLSGAAGTSARLRR